jgi:osmotically-inducible protein OsmY
MRAPLALGISVAHAALVPSWRVVGRWAAKSPPGGYSRPDAEIRRDIIKKVIVGTVLTDPARFTVTVRDGVVTVEGKPENASIGRDMIEEIGHAEGVVAVRDRLSYPPEPGWPRART